MAYRFILDYHDTWPLWTVKKRVYEKEVWAEIDDIPELTGKQFGLRYLLRELKRLEWVLEHDGIMGWLSHNRRENLDMRAMVLLVGAKKHAEDAEFEYFYKLAGVPKLPNSVMDVFRKMRGRDLHGTA